MSEIRLMPIRRDVYDRFGWPAAAWEQFITEEEATAVLNGYGNAATLTAGRAKLRAAFLLEDSDE